MIEVREMRWMRWERKFLTLLAECRASRLLIFGLWMMSALLAQAQSSPDLSSNAPAPFSTSIIIQDSNSIPTVYGTETFDELTETNFASGTNSISLTGTNGFAAKLATARLLV